MRNATNPLLALLLALCPLAPRAAGQAAAPPSAADLEFFEKKIRPVLADQCYKCHSASAKKLKAGLYLDSHDGLLKGGDNGPAIVPGKPDQSLLIRAIRWADKDLQMPSKEQLPRDVIADFERWVSIGAPWPAEGHQSAVAATQPSNPTTSAANYDHIRKELWSWQPIANPPPPAVKKAAWAKDDIDRFVLAKLEERKLEPSPRADKLALLRRATYDLTGLPPTPDEIDAYVRDDSADAFAKVVDRLLDSPRFGERWGRHWLDVARYAESSGMSRNYVYYYAWRYRDYVIDAFNKDKPYDRFVREQIAGDLINARTAAERDQLSIATGFLTVGPRDYVEKNPRQFEMNTVDEQIDTVSRGVMATTVACARCHDHKFDPIPTAEYYALAGIFASTREFTGVERRRMMAQNNPYSDDRLLKLSAYKASESNDSPDLDREAVRAQARRTFAQLLVTSRTGAGYAKPINAPHNVAMGVRDDARPGDIRVLTRGEITQPGDTVARGFLTIPGMSTAPPIPRGESGRLELAQWLTQKDNPLTARVMANRVWQHLFGFGLVRSVDNFGVTGERPSHPELLDHLAARFMNDGWSVKRLIRAVMLSNTYQQSATFDRAKFDVDPDNRLLWRMNQRRLEAEAIRDGILAASGKLVSAPPVGSIALDLPPLPLQGPGANANRIDPAELLANMNFRSVYLPIFRNDLPDALDAFDFADPSMVNGQRDVTTVAPQALFMLNNSFVTSHAQALAYRVAKAGAIDATRVDLAYRLTLGRPATSPERDRATAFVTAYARESIGRKTPPERARVEAWSAFCQALFASAEFRYLN